VWFPFALPLLFAFLSAIFASFSNFSAFIAWKIEPVSSFPHHCHDVSQPDLRVDQIVLLAGVPVAVPCQVSGQIKFATT
jgi:hypothetical protein